MVRLICSTNLTTLTQSLVPFLQKAYASRSFYSHTFPPRRGLQMFDDVIDDVTDDVTPELSPSTSPRKRADRYNELDCLEQFLLKLLDTMATDFFNSLWTF